MLDDMKRGKVASMWPGHRHRHPVASHPAALVAIAVSASLGAGDAAAQWYVGVGIGGNASRDVVVESRGNDRASVCDEYINPRALSVPGCASPGRGAGDGWRAPFDPGAGLTGEAEVGFRLSARWRLAAAYSRGATDFDQTVSSTDATGADFDKIGNELSVGEETLRSATAEELRIVAYRGWPNRTRWTPYVGAGVAVSRAQGLLVVLGKERRSRGHSDRPGPTEHGRDPAQPRRHCQRGPAHPPRHHVRVRPDRGR